MRKENINISKARKKELLEYHRNKYGKKIYDVTPSQITQKDINYMVNVINKRLYNLEKKGLTEESNEYQILEKYANQGSPYYNVNKMKGTVRLKTSTKGMSSREREGFINTLRSIMRAKTSTAKGTKEAAKARYEGFLASEGYLTEDGELDYKALPREKYDEIWRAFRRANKDRKEKYNYSLALDLMADADFQTYSAEDMDKAFRYMAEVEKGNDKISPLEAYQLFKQTN